MAFDLSLTGTGVCLPDGQTLTIHTKLRGMPRLARIRGDVTDLVTQHSPRVVPIEGYSFGSPNQAVYLGELGGVIRLALWERGICWVDIPPKCRCKYACGNGNAGKPAVVSAATHRAGREFPNSDEADSWWLWQMALAHYDPESPLLVQVPAVNRQGLVNVNWIELEGA